MKSTPVMAPRPEPARGRQSTLLKGKGKGKKKPLPTPAPTTKPAPSSGPQVQRRGELVPGFYINVGLFAVPTNGTNAFRTLEKARQPARVHRCGEEQKGPLDPRTRGPGPEQRP